jgi:membrane protease YdiL (CAAX protease family)
MLALDGLGTGLGVAVIEETFVRGAMQAAITRESGTRLAILLTSLVYSATHFIGRYRVAPADVRPGSGIDLLAGALADFAHPMLFIDAFLCLAAVGALLGMVRALTGNIAACIGLHAAWVAVIYVVRETSVRRMNGPWTWSLSHFDGYVGWLMLAWTPLIAWALYRWYGSRSGAGEGISGEKIPA